jgi:hypothetical protein
MYLTDWLICSKYIYQETIRYQTLCQMMFIYHKTKLCNSTSLMKLMVQQEIFRKQEQVQINYCKLFCTEKETNRMQ